MGLVAAFLVSSAEREPEMVLALLIFFAAFEVFFLALIAFWALPVLGVLAWWEILPGTWWPRRRCSTTSTGATRVSRGA